MTSDAVDRAKRMAGKEAASLVRPGQVVGLGTGSTAAMAIEELGRRMREEGLAFTGVATSYQAMGMARSLGIAVRSLDEVSSIDIAIDGADEVDPAKNLIKGGGGAHLREKVIAGASDLFVVVVDESKLVSVLGERMSVPVEVLPMAVATVARRIRSLGGEPELRTGIRKDGPVITDNGNMILDVRFGPIADPAGLERALREIPGLLESGLFVGLADLVICGDAGAQTVRRIT